ncbi:response regulator [Luteitalea sp. TBR-22]|uniref:response regulator n=1 Tax=Luteitalea sp. TBR-22 TaxID=2802971 RepID=UPI001AFBC6B7|nr:response regulator [Luteitalea sp. TBR-22]BCS31311.1 response regulator [Luteitalea sp. TBR-22]
MVDPTLTILLAEDDDGHAWLVERHLRRAGVQAAISRASDGQAALDYVHGRNAVRPGPLLVLLDIRMPRVDGVEVLRQLKSARATAAIPVIMLTTTDNPAEIRRCYALGCNVYLTKPVAADGLAEAMRRLGEFLAIMRVSDEASPTPQERPS